MWAPPCGPPVRFQIRKLSTVPQSNSPDSACSRAFATLCSIHLLLLFLSTGDDLSSAIEDDKSRARRSLIDGANVLLHLRVSSQQKMWNSVCDLAAVFRRANLFCQR